MNRGFERQRVRDPLREQPGRVVRADEREEMRARVARSRHHDRIAELRGGDLTEVVARRHAELELGGEIFRERDVEEAIQRILTALLGEIRDRPADPGDVRRVGHRLGYGHVRRIFLRPVATVIGPAASQQR